MRIKEKTVGIKSCPNYHPENIKENIDILSKALSFVVRPGDRVLLKPNLISASRSDGLACTHPGVVAGVAEWFVDHGARVTVGDSPAFGTARAVMNACGITAALRGLPVKTVEFRRVRPVRLASGISFGLAADALDCDMLVNLPKIKTHSQLFVTLAVKNYFGTVVGVRKPWFHVRYGECAGRFAGMLTDLLAALPGGPVFADGITAMQGSGPVKGHAFPLNILAASMNPVALDTALLAVLGLEHSKSPVWGECSRRGLAGAILADLSYPLLKPCEVLVDNFTAPLALKPISFNPYRILAGGVRRLVAGLR